MEQKLRELNKDGGRGREGDGGGEKEREDGKRARRQRGREEEEEGAVNSESKEDRDGGERGRI